MKKLILIDGNALIFRAFYATQMRMTRTEDNRPTNALYLFSTIILKLLQEHNFDDIIVALDSPGKKIRHQEFENYKANRKQIPDELKIQFPMIKEFLNVANIQTIEVEGYEADDIIGSLSKLAIKAGYLTQVYTGDRDLLQLIDENVHICMMHKGLSEVEVFDKQHLKDVYQIEPRQIIDVKSLMGDASDNIPGVRGVGEKTAFDLIIRYGSLNNVYASIDEIKGKLHDKLLVDKEMALLSYQLATIDTKMPLDFDFKESKYVDYDKKNMNVFLKKYNIKSLLKYTIEADTNEVFEVNVEIVNRVSQELLQPNTFVYVDFAGENYHYGQLRGIALANATKCEYIEKDLLSFDLDCIDFLSNEKIAKQGYDLKKSFVLLEALQIYPKGFDLDILLANYLLNQNINDDPMTMLDMYDIHIEPQKRIATFEEYAHYAGKIAKGCYIIKEKVLQKIKEIDNEDLLFKVEIPLAMILKNMEQRGVLVDTVLLDQLANEYENKIQSIEKEIRQLVGKDESFNLNSSRQLADLLYNELHLPCNKKMSTTAEDLTKIASLHPVVNMILEYRKYTKLLNTYIDAFYTYKDDTNRIHALFNQSSTMTGRLSSSQPNLQNLSVRDDSRMIIRKLMIAPQGYKIISLDYSQIELRLLAILSKDETMLKAFKQEEDIHTLTASKVFKVPLDQVSKEQRRIAKAVNFGIVYGISSWGLSEQINVDVNTAKNFIETFFETFPKVKLFLESNIHFCKENGYVVTMLKRRRSVPEIHAQMYQMKEFGKRVAMNTPIQGSAADIIKVAMIAVDKYLQENANKAYLICQIHDELLFEVKEEYANEIANDIQKIMEQVIDGEITLKVNYSIGNNWLEAK